MHIEAIGFTAIVPGGAAAAVPGDSLQVKFGTKPRIMNVWCDYTGNGYVQITFPTAHDTTRGWRNPVVASEVTNRMPMGFSMPLTPQEQMAINISSQGGSGNVENGVVLMAYDSMPGADQNLISWSDVLRRGYKMTTVQFVINPSSAGAWSGAEAINADSDLLLANRNYALLGIELQNECCAISIKGPDTSGVRIAVPGSTEFADQSANYFALLSRAFGNADTIPVINSANKANTLLECLQDGSLGAVTASLQLVLLD